ncbi:VPS35 endosomal protein sorting factor-like [Pistacia vera]|uniref:VPS35 endosomal protein sorting factor-like n=1 Tax=Pistacia vera TaxID=55513 RepID=UPI0012639D02|nr:VPS35 endosomal protein sorting factor-like [Pistacia vera]
MEFRPRDYAAEDESHALPRLHADDHPLFSPSPLSDHHQVEDVVDCENSDFFDPLRAADVNAVVPIEDIEDGESSSMLSSEASSQVSVKEWISFKRFLMQKFPVSKMVSLSSVSKIFISFLFIFKILGRPKSSTSMHLEELDDPQKFADEGVKVITGKEYVSRLHELKDEINRSWHAEDRVTSLKLSIKVARLLMDTSVLQFYPTLFILATEVMDILGDMVWERIKQKAEFAEDGTRFCSLPENFKESSICFDAKETCNNWFHKVGTIRELLPRIYLELAILPCWRFLHDQHVDTLQRLVLMTRGLGDPLASAYCRLYLAHRARKLPSYDMGHLITSVNDIKILLMWNSSTKESTHGKSTDNKRLLVSLMEPTIEYIMKCIFKDASQRQVGNALVELGLGRNQVELFGSNPYVSVILHHLLKELPTEIVSSNAVEILRLIECSNDDSFDQCLNHRLLGFRLSESKPTIGIIHAVVDRIIQVVTVYDKLDDYLKVVDAYVDIILQDRMDNHLNTILEGISERACCKEIVEDEVVGLQSILMKFLSHFRNLEDVLALGHFLEILDVMYGNSQNFIYMQILSMATRNGNIHDPTTVQLVFEICQSLHDGMDFANMKDDDHQQPARLISRFVQMVDYGVEMEGHLTFLVECRGAFGGINELKETLVHSSNCLVTKALKDGRKHLSFVKSCIAFSEVTIPSISTQIRQLNLYLETAEVAMLAGLVSHADGLIDSAVSCLKSVDLINGFQAQADVDEIVISIRKLCSLLVMVPGNPELGLTSTLKNILPLVNSQSWMTSRMKIRIFSAIVSLSATLSQNKLPYHTDLEIPGNDLLFYGNSSYVEELASFSEDVLKNLVEAIEQEPSTAARGNMALEACNCIVSSFKINEDIRPICSKLIETAKLHLNSNNEYLQSTIKFLDQQSPTSGVAA